MDYEKKLIEGNFPCGQVGAETRRERSASSALPPLYFLHVWWARRPLTASRGAILGSVLSPNVKSEDFIKELGIRKFQVCINGTWVDIPSDFILNDEDYILWNSDLQRVIENNNKVRKQVRDVYNELLELKPELKNSDILMELCEESKVINYNNIQLNQKLNVRLVPANPVWFNSVMSLFQEVGLRIPNLYGYDRAYKNNPKMCFDNLTLLDATAGGGSIPFEAARLGFNVIANDLNPIASIIEKATIEFPLKFGEHLKNDLHRYGKVLVDNVNNEMAKFYEGYEINDDSSYIYYRDVICPHCGKHAPLLNSFCLSKKRDGWMVIPNINGDNVNFTPVRLIGEKGPNGENPEKGTVKRGVGTCIFCHQAISSRYIKEQACYGKMDTKLYCVVSEKNGLHFRKPVQKDFDNIDYAKSYLKKNWERWESQDLIPIENIPVGHKTAELLNVGVNHWCDMFMPRQLIGHLTCIECLNKMIPGIIDENGFERATAIITYLQYMIDKCIVYNGQQTRWDASRTKICSTFERHDFAFRWTIGERIYTGNNSSISWGERQIVKCYGELCDLLSESKTKSVRILNDSAANLTEVENNSVDVLVWDPPYYNNVQYAELSDYFYVWEKRVLKQFYPKVFQRKLSNKQDEAVANPVRDGNIKKSKKVYETLMSEIFEECYRVLKANGIMVMMFTHKEQDAWETLTKALIEKNWVITSTFPVDSESSSSIHQKDMAAAASSIFISCRKRDLDGKEPSQWKGLSGTGVLPKLQKAVEESLRNYEELHLNSVDEMVASYGNALKVLSENWPVMNENDELVTPTDAMREASRIVAQYQLAKFTDRRIQTGDIIPEAEASIVFLGVYGLGYLSYDDALSMSKSLNMMLEQKSAGYVVKDRIVGYTAERKNDDIDDNEGYYAPILKKGSKLRLALPEERNRNRIDKPQTEWDIMQGTILKYREGKVPVARNYLQTHAAGKEDTILGLLKVWQENCGNEELKKETERLLFGLNMGK